MVISCRIAQKRVEHAFFQMAGRQQDIKDAGRLRASLVRTGANEPLRQVLDETHISPCQRRHTLPDYGDRYEKLMLIRPVAEIYRGI